MFEEPPILLQASHFVKTKEEQALFFISLEINDLCLHNCMLEYEASINIISLKVMNQLGMKITGPYANVCGFESNEI
jgi:hypothetical protein